MFTNGGTRAGGTIWTHRKLLLAALLHGMHKRGLIAASNYVLILVAIAIHTFIQSYRRDETHTLGQNSTCYLILL